MSYFIVRKRDPRTDEPPCDGTQIVYGFKDGEVLAGDAHWAWQEPSDADEPDVEVDPDIVWWFNAERDLGPSEQLLADLRRILDLAEGMRQNMLRRPTHFNGYIELEIQERERADGEAIARVRALLPEEDNDGG